MEPCEFFKECKDLRESVKSFNSKMENIERVVNKINDALVGTLTEQGFIGKFHSADEKNSIAIDDLIQWRNKCEGYIQKAIWKLAGASFGILGTGAVISFILIKYYVG